jgi:MFS family permease
VASSAPRRSLFRKPNFAKLWTAATISLFGTGISQLAIPFIAAVVLKASPGEVGLLSTIEFLPFLLFTLPAGVWVDRFPRRRILVVGDLGRAAMLVSIPIAAVTGVLTIWQLYLVGFVNGVMTVFFDVADQSYLPTVLERDELADGNAKLQLSQSAAQILGQPFGGGIIALLTAPVAVFVDAVSYLGSAALILSIREKVHDVVDRRGAPATPADVLLATEADDASAGATSGVSVAAEAAAAERPWLEEVAKGETPVSGAGALDQAGTMREQIFDGLRFILGHEYLGNIAATTGISNLFTNIGGAIFPVYAYRTLGMTPATVGLIGGLAGAGILLGALVTTRIQDRIGVGRTIVLGAAATGPAGLLVPIASPDTAVLLIGASFFLVGICNVVYNVSQVSLRQAITPDRMLGRMNASMRFLVWGTIPIGSLIGAGLSEVIGVQQTIWVSAILGLFAFLQVLISRVPGIQTIPTGEPEPTAA